jgi:hypothetical protein
MTEELRIKHLSAYGILENDLEKIALNSDHKANPVKFEKDELVEMLRRRL